MTFTTASRIAAVSDPTATWEMQKGTPSEEAASAALVAASTAL